MSQATPILASLRPTSTLRKHVKVGIGAVEKSHKSYIDERLRAEFADSLETDENLKKDRDTENRWDYLLGHASSRVVVGLEPHTANNDAVNVVIKKREKALEQLRPHLVDGAKVRAWFWVASGKVDFLPMEKATTRLANSGIAFVGKQLLAKHLAALEPATKKTRKA
jgi:hypothetical protein